MKRTTVLLFFFMLLFFSCKKDKLNGDYVALVGGWKWVYTENSSGWCIDSPNYETIQALSYPESYRVEFLKSGKLHFYQNNSLAEKHRIVFNYFEEGTDGAYYFYFYLDNDLEKGMAGSIHGDTLHFDYPLVEANPDCENYLNFLVRE